MAFAHEKSVKAVRKRHRCEACRLHIEIDQPATRWAGLTEGEFSALIFHPECRAAEIALNDKNRTYFDDWTGLEEMDPDDHSWLLERHPVAAARLGVTLSPTPDRAGGDR